MSTPATANEFLSVVRKSGLLDEKEFARHYHSEEMLPDDPQECATELTKAGLLTSFQAKTLLTGKYKGFLLGPYKVLQPIGKGGMGVVYLAEHTSLKRRVAVKILPKEYADDKLALERFFREARAAAALDHPNIVGIHDITQGAGTHFLVMEYVEGVTLDELMQKTGRMHYAQAVDYVAQAATGLQHAHDKGFVHRDIKPGNLMVTKDGKVKILDMGLARSFENAADNLTAQLGDGGVAGTADFVSPEQALNDPVDARSDVYSLGATLYALIAGRPPFTGNTSQKLLQHQLTEPPKLSKTNATVPAELSDVVAVMMAKNPDDRFSSAEEVIDALTPWLPAAPSTTAVGLSMTTKELKAALTSKRLTGASSTRGLRIAAEAAAAALPATRNRKPLYVGLGVAGLLLAGTVAFFASQPKELSGTVTLPPETPTPAPPPVAAKKIPGVLSRTSWESVPVAKFDLKNVQKSSSFVRSPLPAPWSGATTRTNMGGEFEILDVDGSRILSIRNTARNTPGVRIDTDDALCTLKGNFRYVVKVEYKTDKGVRAWVEARYSTDAKHQLIKKNLTESQGEWATAEFELLPQVEMPLYLTVCNEGRNTERLYLKTIDVIDARLRNPAGTSSAGGFLVLPFDKVATASTAERLFSANNNQMPEFEEWGAKEFNRVPFHVIDPANGTKNIILLNGSQGQAPPEMPKSVAVPVNARVAAFHVLGGVSGWGWPYASDPANGNRGAPEGTVSVVARVRYADGTYEDHDWKNGEHFCDYGVGNNAAKFEAMTGSTLAFELKGKKHVRYLVVRPVKSDVVKEIEFRKGPDDDWTAPMILAVTAERAAEKK